MRRIQAAAYFFGILGLTFSSRVSAQYPNVGARLSFERPQSIVETQPTPVETPSLVTTNSAGAAQLSVPLKSPVFYGLEPSLSIVYSSADDAMSPIARGWKIAAQSTILRKSKFRGLPRMDGTDSFELDGNPLVACPSPSSGHVSPSCQFGGSHYQRTDDGSRTTREGLTAWTIESKDGRRREFAVVGPDQQRWDLTSERDTKGHQVSYTYHVDNGWPYLSEIRYGNNPNAQTIIKYRYGPRTDIAERAQRAAVPPLFDGFGRIANRLVTIEVSAWGLPARAMSLRYAVGIEPLLSETQEFGSDYQLSASGLVVGGASLPVRSFAHHPFSEVAGDIPQPSAISVASPVSIQSPMQFPSVQPDSENAVNQNWIHESVPWQAFDFDGDSKADFFGPFVDATGTHISLRFRGSRPPNNALTTVSTGWQINPRNITATQSDDQHVVFGGRFNGDRFSDIFFVRPTANFGAIEVRVAQGSPSGLVFSNSVVASFLGDFGPTTSPFLVRAGDLNGDGLTDIAVVQANKYFPTDPVLNSNDEFSVTKLISVGDGTFSVDAVSPFPGRCVAGQMYVCFSFPTVANLPLWHPKPDVKVGHRLEIADVDGNGQDDFVFVEIRSVSTVYGIGLFGENVRVHYALSFGASGATQAAASPAIGPAYGEVWFDAHGAGPQLLSEGDMLMADFDGDGRSDWLGLAPGGVHNRALAQVAFSVSGGDPLESNGYRATSLVTEIPDDLLSQISPGNVSWMASDIDGDGAADLVSLSQLDFTPPIASGTVHGASSGTGRVRIRWFRSDRNGRFLYRSELSPDAESLRYECLAQPSGACTAALSSMVALDVNGDGRSEIATITRSLTGSTMAIAVSKIDVRVPTRKDWAMGDFNGDGRPDMARVAADVTGNPVVQVSLRTASGFDEQQEFVFSTFVRDWTVVAVDIGTAASSSEPDGKTDLVFLGYEFGSTVSAQVLFSAGSGQFIGGAATSYALPSVLAVPSMLLIGDFDGDVRPEVISVSLNGNQLGALHRLFVTPSGTLDYQQIAVPTGLGSIQRFLAGDADGDGVLEILCLAMSGNDLTITALSVDTGIASVKLTGASAQFGRNSAASLQGWRALDVQSDGVADLVNVARVPSGELFAGRLVGNGSGYVERAEFLSTGPGVQGPWLSLADIDNDGLLDLSGLSPPVSGLQPRVVWARGTHSGWGGTVASHALAADFGTQGERYWTMGATDGPSLAMAAWSDVSSGPALRILDIFNVTNLRMARNGLGLAETVRYGSSKGHHSHYFALGSIPVVASIATATFSGYTTPWGSWTTSFSWNGLAYSRVFRSLEGFASVTQRRQGVNHPYFFPRASQLDESSAISFDQASCPGLETSKVTVRYPNETLSGRIVPGGPFVNATTEVAYRRCEPASRWTESLSGQRVNHRSYIYNAFGNVVLDRDNGQYADANYDGIDDVESDNVEHSTIFEPPNLSNYLVSLPRIRRTRSMTTGIPILVEQTIYEYDNYPQVPQRGELAAEVGWWDIAGVDVRTAYSYDAWGNRTRETSPENVVTEREFDSQLHSLVTKSCVGEVGLTQSLCKTQHWDIVAASVDSVSDENGGVTTSQYDAFGRLVGVAYPDTGCLAISYLDYGGPSQRVRTDSCETPFPGDVNGLWDEKRFDGLGRTYHEALAGGSTRWTAYHASSSNVVAQSEWSRVGLGPTVSNEFDASWRRFRTWNADGSTLTVRAAGFEEWSEDELGQVSGRIVDGRLNLKRLIDGAASPDESIAYFEYDWKGRLTRAEDSGGGVRTLSYDSRGNVGADCDSNRGCTAFEYRQDGKVHRAFEPRGFVIDYGYDSFARKVSAQHASGADLWFYDVDPRTGYPAGASRGRLVATASHTDVREYFHFDIRGRVDDSTRCAQSTCATMLSVYDRGGLLSDVAYPDGETVHYTFSLDGLPRSASGYVNNVDYDASGRIERLEFSNGSKQTWVYDPLRPFLKETRVVDQTNSLLFAVALTRDARGDPQSRTATDVFGNSSDTYTHDALGRLTEIVGSSSDWFVYGRDGNILETRQVGSYAYNDFPRVHAVTSAGVQNFWYDAAGNMAHGRPGDLFWTPTGLLKRAETPQSKFDYEYTADGLRVVKRDLGSSTTQIYFDDRTELVGSSFQNTVFVGPFLVATSQAGVKTYLASDERGSPVLALNQSSQLVGAARFSPFGRVEAGSVLARGLTGHRFDTETGFVYMGARYYDPSIGRFASTDPVTPELGGSQALNRYAYVVNRPLAMGDPDGREGFGLSYLFSVAGLADLSRIAYASGDIWNGKVTTEFRLVENRYPTFMISSTDKSFVVPKIFGVETRFVGGFVTLTNTNLRPSFVGEETARMAQAQLYESSTLLSGVGPTYLLLLNGWESTIGSALSGKDHLPLLEQGPQELGKMYPPIYYDAIEGGGKVLDGLIESYQKWGSGP